MSEESRVKSSPAVSGEAEASGDCAPSAPGASSEKRRGDGEVEERAGAGGACAEGEGSGERPGGVDGECPQEKAARRRHERSHMCARVRVHELDNDYRPGDAFACESVDISCSGIGLFSRRMIHPDRRVVVCVPLKGNKTKVLYGVVRYSRYQCDGLHQIGVEFSEPPNVRTLRAWIAKEEGEDRSALARKRAG